MIHLHVAELMNSSGIIETGILAGLPVIIKSCRKKHEIFTGLRKVQMIKTNRIKFADYAN